MYKLWSLQILRLDQKEHAELNNYQTPLYYLSNKQVKITLFDYFFRDCHLMIPSTLLCVHAHVKVIVKAT